jgi:transposase
MTLTGPERTELERRVASRRGRADEARRARCVLLATDSASWTTIRAQLGCRDSYIAGWTGRFARERLAGLYSRHRGQPATTLTPRVEARILEATRRGPGGGTTHWSTRRLGQHVGVSHMMVARVWAKHGLKPHRLERYMASTDPDFERKAADILGLYLKPPQHAAVFGVDEKTAIQALDRLDPVLPLSPGARRAPWLRVRPARYALPLCGL